MKIVQKFLANNSYSEVGQANPIRFSIGNWDKDTQTFTCLLREFKCKDYLNDVAYLWANPNSKFQKTSHTQYGFPMGVLPYEQFRKEGGFHLLLTNLVPEFEQHANNFLDKFIDKYAPDVGLGWTFFPEEKAAVFWVPEFYMLKTYRISLLTFLMRMCNHTSDPVANPTIMSGADQGYWKSFTKFFSEAVFYVPEQFEKYTTVVSSKPEKYDLEGMSDYSAFASIHDNGFIGCMSNIFPELANKPSQPWSL